MRLRPLYDMGKPTKNIAVWRRAAVAIHWSQMIKEDTVGPVRHGATSNPRQRFKYSDVPAPSGSGKNSMPLYSRRRGCESHACAHVTFRAAPQFPYADLHTALKASSFMNLTRSFTGPFSSMTTTACEPMMSNAQELGNRLRYFTTRVAAAGVGVELRRRSKVRPTRWRMMRNSSAVYSNFVASAAARTKARQTSCLGVL
jgi:hypothetical protein